MKIVQSFWSKPIRMKDNSDAYFRDSGGWLDKSFFYMSWALSCLTLKKVYGEVELVTDQYGKELLYDTLKLPYASVSTDLDRLENYNHNLWALGKLYTYSIQEQPFIHVDSDIFVWEKFSPSLLQGEVITQNLEEIFPGMEVFFSSNEHLFTAIPECVKKEREVTKALPMYNAGILGGNNMEFIQLYTKTAFDFIHANHAAIDKIPKEKGYMNMVYEQYFLYCLVKHYNIPVATYFSHGDLSFDGMVGFHRTHQDVKYIHALGTYKKYEVVGNDITERVLYEYPEYYYRINRLLSSNII